MVNVREFFWDLFFNKQKLPKQTRFAFADEKPKIGENFYLKACVVEKQDIKMLRMQTDIVHKVSKITPDIMEVQTKNTNFIVSASKNVGYEFISVPPIAGEDVDEILYQNDKVYICKCAKETVCYLTA